MEVTLRFLLPQPVRDAIQPDFPLDLKPIRLPRVSSSRMTYIDEGTGGLGLMPRTSLGLVSATKSQRVAWRRQGS